MTATGKNPGQVTVFFLMVLVILFFVVLWNFDLHKILHVKSISQNAGDAAALAAARWQGISLNLIGDLNIMTALALSQGDSAAVSAISNIQARLCYAGPMIAFVAAQQGAKNNGIYENTAFTARLREHAKGVRNDYGQADSGGEPLFPEPYPNCWQEYANMLDLVANDGVAAGPDNAQLYTDYTGGHFLLMIDFYEAIAGRNWCWFYHDAPNLLEEYSNFFPCWWAPLPPVTHREYINSEIFGLGVARRTTSLSEVVELEQLLSTATERGLETPVTNIMNESATWYCYDELTWSTWEAMAVDGPDPFPATGPVRPQYDYAGADAAVRVEACTERLTPGPSGSVATNTITWTAAAKPFGYLNEEDLPNRFGLVLPAFHEVRLIPVDASSAPSGGAYNLDWRTHIEEHLPDYMANGPVSSSCWYCQQLVVWEDQTFRQFGVDWLEENSWRCTLGGGPGRHRGGGRRRGH